MNEKVPDISVVVPVYNVITFLKRCIGSILGQTFRDFEVILVDDGSTDGSGEICDEIANSDSRVVTIHKENGGLSEARNFGIDVAKGKYLFFVDSDDYIHADTLSEMYRVAQQTGADIVECDYKRVTSKDQPGKTKIESHNNSKVNLYTHDQALIKMLNYDFNVVAWNKLYLSSLFENIRYPVGKLHEDEFTTPLVIDGCSSYATIDKAYYMYTQREGSIMNTSFSEKELDVIEAYKLRLAYFQNKYGNRFDTVINFHLFVACTKILNEKGYHPGRYDLKIIQKKLFNDLSKRIRQFNAEKKLKLFIYRFIPGKVISIIKGGSSR